MVDQLAGQIQEKVSALEKTGISPAVKSDVTMATRLISDADKSKQVGIPLGMFIALKC